MRDKQIRLMSVDIGRNVIVTFIHSLNQTSSLFSAYYLLLIIPCLLLASCGSTPSSAPVIDRILVDPSQTVSETDGIDGKEGQRYIVKKGDTFYSIALNHGINYNELAEWNGIEDPSTIKPGQSINLSVPSKQAQPSLFALPRQAPSTEIDVATQSSDLVPEVNTATRKLKTEPKAYKLLYSEEAVAQLQRSVYPYPIMQTTKTAPPAEKIARIEAAPTPASRVSDNKLNSSNVEWMWPATGKLLASFSKKSKGIKISGESGQPVLASAEGKVVYSGDGLRGYGKLIIIKHSSTFLSAYAHNSKILVMEAETVEKGQKIAEMGSTDADRVNLHFEIRKHGKPVDPLKFLPSGRK